jgi:hypothetical protein
VTIAHVAGSDGSNSVGSGGAVTCGFGSTNGLASHTPTAGNMLLAMVMTTGGGVGTNNTPSGWTKQLDVSLNGASGGSITVFTKISAGNETTVAFTGVGVMQVVMSEFSGTANPVVVDVSGSGTSGTTTVTTSSTFAPSITITAAGDLLISFVGLQNTSGGQIGAWNSGGTTGFSSAVNRILAGWWLPGSTGAKTDYATWTTSRAASQIEIAFKPSAVSLTSALSDTASASDAIGRSQPRSRALSDTAAADDAIGRAQPAARALSDTAAAADALARSQPRSRALSDSGAAADALTAAWRLLAALADTANAADAIGESRRLLAGLADTAHAADAVATAVTLSAHLADTAHAVDGLGIGGGGFTFFNDSAAADDTLAAAWRLHAPLSDSAQAADALGRARGPAVRSLSDTAAAADAVHAPRGLAVSISDSAHAASSLTGALSTSRTLSDSAGAADALGAAGGVGLIDTAFAADALTGLIVSIAVYRSRGVVTSAARVSASVTYATDPETRTTVTTEVGVSAGFGHTPFGHGPFGH